MTTLTLYSECPSGKHPHSVTHDRVERPPRCVVPWCKEPLDWNKKTRKTEKEAA